MKNNRLFMGYLQAIVASKDDSEREVIFNDTHGIDISYQQELLTWDQHQLLLKLINKLQGVTT